MDIWTQVIQHWKGNSEKGTPSFCHYNMRGTELWCCDNLQLCATKVELILLIRCWYWDLKSMCVSYCHNRLDRVPA